MADGAAWIWNLVGDYFYDSTQVVDWYHANKHLANAAQQLYPQDEGSRKRWLHEQKTVLFQGHADRIVQHLKTKAESTSQATAEILQQETGYFETHKHRIYYLDFRNAGWLIGSGTVESAAKQYKHRFTGPGMRWSRTGLENPKRTSFTLSRRGFPSHSIQKGNSLFDPYFDDTFRVEPTSTKNFSDASLTDQLVEIQETTGVIDTIRLNKTEFLLYYRGLITKEEMLDGALEAISLIATSLQ